MCRNTGQPGAAIRPRCATIRRWGLRYEWHSAQGRVRHNARMHATIRSRGPVARRLLVHDMAQCALPGRSARSLCTQAGFKVCTWCTQPSFDSVHCFSHY